MVEYYVDSITGDNADNGTTPALAWATVEYALESGALAAGDNVWTRRLHSEIPTTDIAPAYDGTAGSPISVIGWPRDEEGAGSGVWANSESKINDVAGLEMDSEKHTGRRVKQDTDNHWYIITYIPYIRQEAGAIKLAFVDSNPDTITDTDARINKRNFVAGDKIRITGSTSNDGIYTIASTVAGTITLSAGDTLNAENAINGTKIQVYDRFIIDRQYAGTDTGDFTIQKDDDFDTRPAAARVAWDPDADDLPIIDFNGAVFNINMSIDLYHVFKNMEFKNSSDGNGIIYNLYGEALSLIGCLLGQNQNKLCLKMASTFCYLERVIIEGSGAGNAQTGLRGDSFHLKYCAIYNMGDNAIYEVRNLFMENVNLGVEQANGDNEITLPRGASINFGRDVKLGGTNGYVSFPTYQKVGSSLQIENYNKVLGAHKTWFTGGTIEKVTSGTGAPVPNQRAGGAANIIEITPNVSGYEFIEDWAVEVFSHEYEVGTTTRTWRFYIQTNIVGGLTATNLWITAEYINAYDDTSEYVITTTKSNESITARSDINDWSQYIEVPSVIPAVASKVRIKCYVSKYDAANKIWIDPKVANP